MTDHLESTAAHLATEPVHPCMIFTFVCGPRTYLQCANRSSTDLFQSGPPNKQPPLRRSGQQAASPSVSHWRLERKGVDGRDRTCERQEETALLFEKLRELGVLVGKGKLHGNVFRIKPSIYFTKDDADSLVDALDHAVSKL